MTHDTSRWKPAPLRLRLVAALCGSTVSRILDSAAPLRLHLAEAECKGTEEEVRAVGKQLKLASLVARDWEVWESGVLFDTFRSCFCQFAFYCIKKFLM